MHFPEKRKCFRVQLLHSTKDEETDVAAGATLEISSHLAQGEPHILRAPEAKLGDASMSVRLPLRLGLSWPTTAKLTSD